MSKIIIIAFLVLLIAGAGGWLYYYEIYMPQNYAVSLLELYSKLEAAGLQPNTSSLKDNADYENAVKILDQRNTLIKSIKSDLEQQEAPKQLVNFKKEFSFYLDLAEKQHAHGLKIGLFLANAKKLIELIAGIYGADFVKEKITTIGELQKFWGERIPKTFGTAETLFKEEFTEFSDPSFYELKLLWEGASPAFDLVLNIINATNPRFAISHANNMFTPSEQKRLADYTKKLEEFNKKLDALLKKYNAYDLLAFRYFPDVDQTESSERALKFYQVMRDLQVKY